MTLCFSFLPECESLLLPVLLFVDTPDFFFLWLSTCGASPWTVLITHWNVDLLKGPLKCSLDYGVWQNLVIVRWDPHNKWTTSAFLMLIEAYIFWLEVGNVILLVETWPLISVLHQVKQKIRCRCRVANNNRDAGSEKEGTRRESVKCKILSSSRTTSCVLFALKIGESSLSGNGVKDFLKVLNVSQEETNEIMTCNYTFIFWNWIRVIEIHMDLYWKDIISDD
jgi:hypothetical protein